MSECDVMNICNSAFGVCDIIQSDNIIALKFILTGLKYFRYISEIKFTEHILYIGSTVNSFLFVIMLAFAKV